MGVNQCQVRVQTLDRRVPPLRVPKKISNTLKSSSLAGVSISLLKTLIKHPLDTLTVQVQTSPSSPSRLTLPSLYSGLLPSLTSNILTSPIFFALKDTTLDHIPPTLPQTLRVAIAVAVATPMYWCARTPLETIKSRKQSNPKIPIKDLPREDLFAGLPSNIVYGYPADMLKFVLYDLLKSPSTPFLNTYISGALSTMIAQALTTPLDVKRNRVMCEDYVEVEGGDRWKGVGLRVGKAAVSGAVQFGVYEYVIGQF
ncbi:hypothetical protein TrLO_g15559 [Triparma laevis f. longispina]|uniref:Mitochondrial carrier n=1 Tax=Triparma laevis f. longispina TaxID=1714387 RepID=A0A9W7AGL6_9STRA|nr:hypothetical protein TrLO_g15559 [Triparma laevis f. longispina]